MSSRRLIDSIAIAAALLAPFTAAAQADDFPSKQPIRLIVGFAPGGGTDTIARSLNTRLGEILGQSVVVENRPGAGATLATGLVANAAPDGYTVLFTVSSHSVNPSLYPKLPFDTERDLRGVTLVATLPQVLAAHPSTPANNLKEFLELAKRDPRYRQYATGGSGSPGHFAGAVLTTTTGVSLTPIHYRGGGPANADVMGNQVPIVFSILGGALPSIKAGKLKAIAVTSSNRTPLLPDVGTFAEAGFPDYRMDTWVGTFVPRGTPDAIVAKLHKATVEALKDPTVRARVDAQAGVIVGGSSAELDQLVKREIAEYRVVVQKQGITAD